MDEWLEKNVLGHGDLRKALDPVATPATIMDQEPVRAWFAKVRSLDKGLWNILRFLVLRRSLGLEPSPSALDMVAVSVFVFVSSSRCRAVEPGVAFDRIRSQSSPKLWPSRAHS